MEGTRLGAVPSLQQTVAGGLKAIPEEALSGAFGPLYEPCKLCTEVGGDHNEWLW
jgi:hypothetical protein